MTKVSIVMPTRNSEEFISETLDSLLGQSLQDYELIVCDSQSSDNTLAIIEKKMGSKACVVSHVDTGVPNALNKGFSEARGEILFWLNSDDVLISRDTILFLSTLYQDEPFNVLIGDCVVLSPVGVVEKTLISFAPKENYPSSGGNLFTGSLYFSRNAWRAFGGFSENYKFAFEYELTDFLFSEFKVKKINHLVAGFRIHPAGLSSRFSVGMSQELDELRRHQPKLKSLSRKVNRLNQHIKDKNIHQVVRNWFVDPNRGLHWRQVGDFLD